MNIALFYLKGKAEQWADSANEELEKKISRFFSFERVAIKSKANDRSKSDEKRREEGAALLSKIRPTDYVILFDEHGKTYKSSIEFSQVLIKCLGQKQNRVVFVIGGPYGFSTLVQDRANASWSLSGLTMNHHVAQIVAMEQIYRALTIWKGVPYHNL